MKLTFVKGTAVGSAVAVAMLTATTALAGTGIGAVFNLGKTNTVNATSRLAGKTSGPLLTITAKGTGPALGLHVRKGKAPLTVSSATQVPNLNASLLGGLAAASFVQGSGQVRAYTRQLTGEQSGTLLQIPGYGPLTASCDSTTESSVAFTNNGSFSVDLWNDMQLSDAMPAIDMRTVAPGKAFVLIDSINGPSPVGWDEGMLHYTTFHGEFPVQHVATFEVAVVFNGGTCNFIAEADAGGGQVAP
jgi:hypothetical protein